MATRLEKYQSTLTEANKLLESEEVDKKKLGQVLTTLSSQFVELDDNQKKIIEETLKRKEKIAGLNAQIDELSGDTSLQEKLEKAEKDLSEKVLKLSELEAENTSYFETNKKELISKLTQYKVSENEKLKGLYKGLDDLGKLTHEDVKHNMAKLTEHEAIGVFGSGASTQSLIPQNRERSKSFNPLDLYTSHKKG